MHHIYDIILDYFYMFLIFFKYIYSLVLCGVFLCQFFSLVYFHGDK